MTRIVRYILTVFIAVLSYTSSLAEDFYYKRYDVGVLVRSDNTLSVSEQMDAFFTAPRHGIVRDWVTSVSVKRQLPCENDGRVEKLMTYSIDINNIDVSEEFCIDSEEGMAVRIGSADRYVEGDHHYQIDYDYHIGDDRVSTGDIFFYTLLGAANATNVEEFNFAIRFEEKVPQQSLEQLKLFFGDRGDETNHASTNITLLSDSLITGTVKGLNANEAVTVFMPLPEGYFTCKKADLEGDREMFYWMMGIVAVLLFLVAFREMKSRNNFTTVVECWPPEGLSSADLGYIYDTTVDPCDIISLIPYFAHKGYLTIDTTSGHPVLNKRADIPDDAPVYQKKLFDGFFGRGDVFDTKNPTSRFAERWLDMDKFVKQHNKGMDDKVSPVMLLWILAGVLGFIGLFTNDVCQSGDLALWGIMIAAGHLWIGLSSSILWDKSRYSKLGRFMLVLSWIFVFALQLLVIDTSMEDDEIYLSYGDWMVLSGMYVLSLLTSIFLFRLTHMSKKRLEYIGRILGLKEFIEKSEKPMLDSLLKEHESYFYDILPYAVAFGLSEKWAGQFKDLEVKPADWYRGDDMSLLGMSHWMSHRNLYTPAMTHQVNKLTQERLAAQSAASSHGSGGFSGGGFGGGGSHSW